VRGVVRFAVAVLAAAGVAVLVVPASSQGATDPLDGIWVSETAFGPALRGDLTVSRDPSGWRAAIGTAATRFTVSGERVEFAFPHDDGGFRGTLADGGRAISGFWLQPSGETVERRNPHGTGQSFATPLTLRSIGAGAWRGTARPLDDRFTLYLKITRNPDGTLTGAFRNPESNAIGGAAAFRVTREGDWLHFTARPDETQPPIVVDAKFGAAADTLRVFWPDAGRVLELTRRTPAQVPEFFPRPPGEPAYVYRAPPSLGDGWSTAPARDVGLDESSLARVVQREIDVDPAARRAPLMHSLLIAHHGKLVLEEYFFGFDRERLHDIRSAGKTFGSVMLGAAMMQRARIAPESHAYELLQAMGPFANPDPRKARITLAHLMTHTSGLACDDNDDASPGNEDTMQAQHAQPNWWKYALDLPMARDPGTRYAYCSANDNLLGAALTTATRTSLPELFDRTIARPLQFGPYAWNLMPTGEGYLGGGAFLRPRDLLKLGQAYLDGGVWNGRRIVDRAWVGRSTSPQIAISPATPGLDEKAFANSYLPGEDGFAWHLHTLQAGGRAYREYEANGNGGQMLIVVPELDLAVVFTAGNYGQGGVWSKFGTEIVPRDIIPAIRR
jgi:CubicO group peptidase (beta-lactamase class C family)